jgi:hypothetical protein
MKITQITEATYENVEIIKDIVKFIIDTMPSVIPSGSVYVYGFADNGKRIDWMDNTSSPEIRSIKELIEENKDNPKIKNALIRLSSTPIYFHNTEEKVYHPNYGDYAYGPVNIYVSRIQGSSKPFIIKKTRNNPYPSFYLTKVTQVLFHELRHLFQDVQYPDYLRSKKARIDKKTKTTREWGDRQIEWDAKWTDIISTISPEDYTSEERHAEYTSDVMRELLQWVKLSPKNQKHYRKKTINYFLEWERKKLQKQWNKLVKILEPYVLNGGYDKKEFVDYIIEDLIWYSSGPDLHPQIKNYYTTKSQKYYDTLTKSLKTKNKVKQYIEQYKTEWEKYLENFLDANRNRISEINNFAAASVIVSKLYDNNADFFFSKNSSVRDMAQEVRKHYYKRSVEIIDYVKERQTK